MNRSTPGLPVHHHVPEFTQTHVHRVGDAIQPFHLRLSPSPPAPNPSQHQSFPVSQPFSNYFQRNPRADLLHNRLVGSPCSPRDCHLYPFILRKYEGCSGGHQMFFIFLIEDQPTWVIFMTSKLDLWLRAAGSLKHPFVQEETKSDSNQLVYSGWIASPCIFFLCCIFSFELSFSKWSFAVFTYFFILIQFFGFH